MAIKRCRVIQRKPEKSQVAKMPPEMNFVKILGKGSYGCVQLYKYLKDDGSMVYNAVKIADFGGCESLQKEFKILSQLRESPGIVQCFGDSLIEGFNSDGSRDLRMLMEYAPEGTLEDFMRLNRKLSEPVIKDFTRMILQGLVSIHTLGFVHCDLKPANLLIFPRYDAATWQLPHELKIGDFGMSTKAGKKSEFWSVDSPFVGTPVYMSPESVQGGKIEKTLDLWSLGCIVLQMCSTVQPWFGYNSAEIENWLYNDEAPEIPVSVSSDARQFIEKCFATNPEERGSASELLKHPFLSQQPPIMEAAVGIAAGEETNPLKFKSKIRKSHKKITKKPSKLKITAPKPQSFKKKSIKPMTLKLKHSENTQTL